MPQIPRLTTLCYIERDNQYLMLYRDKKKEDVNEGKWIGVGGKFEKAETPEECLLREVYEETGLHLTRFRFHGIITFILDGEAEYMHLFTASDFTGELTTDCAEGELKWIPKEDVMNLTLWEGDKIFLKLLLEDVPFFSLKLVYHGEKLVEYQLK
jgi:8-oxo-dGTP diphosphatase